MFPITSEKILRFYAKYLNVQKTGPDSESAAFTVSENDAYKNPSEMFAVCFEREFGMSPSDVRAAEAIGVCEQNKWIGRPFVKNDNGTYPTEFTRAGIKHWRELEKSALKKLNSWLTEYAKLVSFVIALILIALTIIRYW